MHLGRPSRSHRSTLVGQWKLLTHGTLSSLQLRSLSTIPRSVYRERALIGCGLVLAGGMGGVRPASRGGMAPPGTGFGGPPPSTAMRGGVRTRHACMLPHAAAPSPLSPKPRLTPTDALHSFAQMGVPPGSRGGAGLRPGSGMRGAAGMQGTRSPSSPSSPALTSPRVSGKRNHWER